MKVRNPDEVFDVKNLLWITRMAPADIDSGGLILQYRYLKVLSKHYKITVVSLKEDYGVNPLIALGIQAFKYYSMDQIHDLITKTHFEIAVLNWWDIASQFFQIIRPFVDRIIVNSIDVEFVRRERQTKMEHHTKHQELNIYNKADKVWFVTEEDRNAVLKYIQVNGDVLPIIQNPLSSEQLKKKVNVPENIYFIGNFLHEPNVEAALSLCENIFPKVLEIIPSMHLYIFGKWPPQNLIKCDSEHIHIKGIVYDLEKWLRWMSICIANLRYGAGLKNKVCEAMSWSIPVVGTKIAFEGIKTDFNNESSTQNAVLAMTNDEFVDAIVFLYNNIDIRTKVGFNGWNTIKTFSNITYELIQSIQGR